MIALALFLPQLLSTGPGRRLVLRAAAPRIPGTVTVEAWRLAWWSANGEKRVRERVSGMGSHTKMSFDGQGGDRTLMLTTAIRRFNWRERLSIQPIHRSGKPN